VIDNSLIDAGLTLLVCSILSFFGVIHSVYPDGRVYFPWELNLELPYHYTIAYFAVAVVCIFVGLLRWFRSRGKKK